MVNPPQGVYLNSYLKKSTQTSETFLRHLNRRIIAFFSIYRLFLETFLYTSIHLCSLLDIFSYQMDFFFLKQS